MRYIICLSYNGAEFCGWQIQPRDPSIQQSVEEALSKLLGCRTGVTGAGRTDSGVSATNYICHFDSERSIDCAAMVYKLNAILPRAIAVQYVKEVPEGFHARFDASKREYTYFLHSVKDPFLQNTSFLCTFPLDFEAMNTAAAMLLGEHDFSCFEKAGADNKTSICTVTRAEWIPYTPVLCSSGVQPEDAGGRYWMFKISADRFLRNMVRAIVGTLIEVGRGKRSVEEFGALVLEPNRQTVPQKGRGSRTLSGESVPGHALFLSGVEYPGI